MNAQTILALAVIVISISAIVISIFAIRIAGRSGGVETSDSADGETKNGMGTFEGGGLQARGPSRDRKRFLTALLKKVAVSPPDKDISSYQWTVDVEKFKDERGVERSKTVDLYVRKDRSSYQINMTNGYFAGEASYFVWDLGERTGNELQLGYWDGDEKQDIPESEWRLFVKIAQAANEQIDRLPKRATRRASA